MKPDITQKLRKAIRSRARLTEATVVYIMVEVRKLLDSTRTVHPDRRYPMLRLYCDWIVHVELNGPQAQAVLKTFDAAYALRASGESRDSILEGEIQRLIHLRTLRREFESFCAEFDLPTIKRDKWISFIRRYADVVQDCPLTMNAKGLNNITKVVVSVEDAIRPDESGYLWFRITWRMHGIDGKIAAFDSYNESV
jgi:hypothetical protein